MSVRGEDVQHVAVVGLLFDIDQKPSQPMGDGDENSILR